MKIAIITHPLNAYAPTRLKEEAEKKGCQLLVFDFSDLKLILNEDKIDWGIWLKGKPIEDFDYFVFRGTGDVYSKLRDYVIEYALKRGVGVLNLETYRSWPCFDKLTQTAIFKLKAIPFVPTKVYGNKDDFRGGFGELPVIVKAASGSHGDHVYKIESREEAEAVLEKYPVLSLLVQPFLAGGEDLRVIVLGGEIIGAIKRVAAPGKFLTNYSAGGRVEKYDIDKDQEAVELALKINSVVKTEYCGIDLMRGEDRRWKVLEVNRSAQFEGFEKATGINMAAKIINYIETKK